jgi:hypothetical protein
MTYLEKNLTNPIEIIKGGNHDEFIRKQKEATNEFQDDDDRTGKYSDYVDSHDLQFCPNFKCGTYHRKVAQSK